MSKISVDIAALQTVLTAVREAQAELAEPSAGPKDPEQAINRLLGILDAVALVSEQQALPAS